MERLVSGRTAAEDAPEQDDAIDREVDIQAVRGGLERMGRRGSETDTVRPRNGQVRGERSGVKEHPALRRGGRQTIGKPSQLIGALAHPDPEAPRPGERRERAATRKPDLERLMRSRKRIGTVLQRIEHR